MVNNDMTMKQMKGGTDVLDAQGPRQSGSRAVHQKRETCRICGGTDFELALSLGPQPLANALMRTPEEFDAEVFYPLDLYYCRQCSLPQLLDVIDPEVLFGHYLYVSGTSETLAVHNEKYARSVVQTVGLTPDDLVVEIASNDGSFLQNMKRHNVRTLGVEPAVNIAQMARERGIDTVNRFFSPATAADVCAEYGPAKAVIATNVLPHVDDTRGFVQGCAKLLAPSGMVILQMQYLLRFMERFEYDTIYHEHMSYISVTSLVKLCEEAGLSVIQAEDVPVHGGSIRIFAGPKAVYPTHGPAVMQRVKEEEAYGLTSFSTFEEFARKVAEQRVALRRVVEQLVSEGKTIAGYGAAAKGNTLLNYCGITSDQVSYIVDKNPMKVGLYSPGTHIPVLPVETLLERQPDYVLILAWNFQEEIVRQQAEYAKRGGKFLVPIPMPHFV